MADNNNYEKSTRQSHDRAIKKQTTDNNSRHSSPHVSGDSRRASGKTRTSDKAKLSAADKKNKAPNAQRTHINNEGRKAENSRHKEKRSVLWNITETTLTVTGRTLKTIWLIIAAILLIAVILIGIGFHVFNNIYTASRKAEYNALESLDNNTFKETGRTVIYDRKGNTIAMLHNTGYKYVTINEISDAIQKTYISSEDKDFLTHNGFSVKGIGRAAVSLLKTGHITQGGSTITQQLVKNTLLSSERTFFRKLTEVFLAVDLEKKYTKADIMEYYLNTCFYGNSCKGIYAASEYYFGKKPSEIGYEEAALLAAISKSPSVYNPEASIKRATEERNVVLLSLKNDGLITAKEYKTFAADKYQIREHETKAEKTSYTASFAIYCAARELMKENGFKFCYRFDDEAAQKAYDKKYSTAYLKYSNALRNGGYRIYTSIDMQMQDKLQKTVDKDMMAVSTEKNDDGRYNTQASATVIDNGSGFVTAVIGGRGTDDEYNRAFLSERQPGSSIKPVVDYGPAFDTGTYYPGRVVSDKKTVNGPKNSEGTYLGKTTIREAIVNSRNTVAYDTLSSIGLDTGLSYLAKMGFSSLSYLDEDNMSISIGGFSYGVKNYELAGAYRAIENGGAWQEPTCIMEIKNVMTGKDVKTDRSTVTVYKDSTAFMLTSAMEDVVKSGTGKGLAIKGMHCAGKTGTTNSLKDGWFAGYTPYYTCAVWVGNDDGTPIYKNFGARYAGKVWKDIQTQVNKGLPDKVFEKPDTVTKMNGDYVAVDKKETAETIDRDDEIKEENDTAEKALRKFEEFNISSEDDIFREKAVYDAASAAISDVSDDDSRKVFLKRLKKKNDELDAEITSWGALSKTQAEYDAEQEEKQVKKWEKEQEQKALDARLTGALNRFDKAIAMIDDATEHTASLDDALSVAADNLAEFEGTDNYDEMKAQYDAAEEKLNSLPDPDEDGEGSDD